MGATEIRTPHPVLGPRDTISGDPRFSLENVNTFPLANGTLCWVTALGALYQFDRTSSAAADGVTVVAPAAGPGRWKPVDAGAAANFNSQFEEFTGGPPSFDLGWIGATSGAGAAFAGIAGEARRPGIVRFATGSTAAGFAQLTQQLVELLPSTGLVTVIESDLRVNVLNGVETFLAKFGICDAFSVPPTNGVFFGYDPTNVNWQAFTLAAGSPTVVDTGVPATTGFVNLRIVLTDAVQADFYLDGVQVASVATTVPSVPIGTGYILEKLSGTTDRTMDVDYFRRQTIIQLGR